MKKLTLTQAFEEYGAKLRNPRWAFTAIARKSLVLCVWKQFLNRTETRYAEKFRRWNVNPHGKKRALEDLNDAFNSSMSVRVVLVCVDDPNDRKKVDAGEATTRGRVQKSFHVRKDLIGTITEKTSKGFVIEFQDGRD